MKKYSASTLDQEATQPLSHARQQGQKVLRKEKSKKPASINTTDPTAGASDEFQEKGGLPTSELEARILARANELAHHRGGKQGQNLHDWLIAAREVLSEEF